MNVTTKELFEVLTPLVLALHDHKILDIAETAHQYEDTLMRRKTEMGDSQESLAFLAEVTQGLHRLAAAVKASVSPPEN